MTTETLRELPEPTELKRGAHATFQEGVCAMELVAWIAHEEHSDHPQCASPVIGGFLRTWNDDMNDHDRQLLRPYLGRIVGTRGTSEQEAERCWMALDWYCRASVPAWLRSAGLTVEAEAVEATNPVLDGTSASVAYGVLDRARASAEAARAAAGHAAGDAAATARDAAWGAARSAAWDAARNAAGDAAREIAAAAAGAAWAASGDAAWAAVMGGATPRPTVRALQRSALDLLDRMIRVTERGEPQTADATSPEPPTS
jgi:hypothetical protein